MVGQQKKFSLSSFCDAVGSGMNKIRIRDKDPGSASLVSAPFYLGRVPGVLEDGHGGGEVVLAELTVLVHHQVDPVPPSREDVVLQRGRP
jgi:hypothetical protein